MTNKSLLQIILIILLLLLLVGCNASSNSSPTPEPSETPAPATTPEVVVTDEIEVAVTPEVIDIIDPLPNNNGEYYTVAAYASITENTNVGQGPGGYYWVIATVTLANEAGETVTVDLEDMSLIGDNGRRYPSYELVERVSPQLANTELAEGDSIYGFALFALPPDVEPSLFEWCPGGTCEAPLQAPISLQIQD